MEPDNSRCVTVGSAHGAADVLPAARGTGDELELLMGESGPAVLDAATFGADPWPSDG
jgi:hypothetical protein